MVIKLIYSSVILQLIWFFVVLLVVDLWFVGVSIYITIRLNYIKKYNKNISW